MTERAIAEADAIEQELSTGVSPQRAAGSKAYLKLDLAFTGATVPQVRAATTAWRKSQPALDRTHLLAVVGRLWERPVFECKLAALLILTDRRALLRAQDLPRLEQLLRESGTWALVDSMAADVAGSLVARFPGLYATLDRWAADEDFWIRRSAMLALLVPLRRGDTAEFGRFGQYADAMLGEREFFIRKAIGWVLRETAKKHPDLVTDWLRPRAHRASGVTMREAVKYLPPEDRDALMARYRAPASSAPPTEPATTSPDS